MNLQEHISRILKEETKMSGLLRRRIHLLDHEIEHRLNTLNSKSYDPNNICRFESGEELLEVISDASIDSMYYTYFPDIKEDHTGKWGKLYDEMVTYINNKYGDKIKEYYHINCGD